jgi:transposase
MSNRASANPNNANPNNASHTPATPGQVYHVGLDVHAASISVAIAEEGGELRFHGNIGGSLASVDSLIKKLARPNRELRFTYEAGAMGYTLARHLAKKGHACVVAAPSAIHRPKGQPKTDTRDALALARLLRAGELTAVTVPDASDELVRDLCRARTDAVQDKRRAVCRIKAIFLRHGVHLDDKTPWSETRMACLRKRSLPGEAAFALEEYIQAADAAHQRILRLEGRMALALETWRQAPVARAIMGLRGFRIVSAMIIVSEIGDIHRFAHPRKLMGYLGLVPSIDSSGDRASHGALTKAGNNHARWLLNEAAQNYRREPKVGIDLTKRQALIPAERARVVKEISWKCQNRLYAKSQGMKARRKPAQKTQIALARELTGFVWAVMRAVQPAPAAPTAGTR